MTNKETVLNLLQNGNILTGRDGYRLNMNSIRDYISMLKHDGYDIKRE